MNEDLNTRVTELEKRMDTMEAYHPDITGTTKALAHGIVSGFQFLFLISLVAGVTTFIVIKLNRTYTLKYRK